MSRCYMISGHRDITPEEFKRYYAGRIEKALWDTNSRIVVGDYYGVDAMAQQHIKDNWGDEPNIMNRVVVFHMFDKPRNNAGFHTIGGFQTDEDRDSAMTDVSDFDILWVRPGKENSGTDQNRLRRLHPNNTYLDECRISNRNIVNRGK